MDTLKDKQTLETLAETAAPAVGGLARGRPSDAAGAAPRRHASPPPPDAAASACRRRRTRRSACSRSAATPTTSRSAAAARCCALQAGAPAARGALGRVQRATASARDEARASADDAARRRRRGRRSTCTTSATATSPTTAPRSRTSSRRSRRRRARPHLHPPPPATSTRTTGSLCELTWNTFRDHLVLEYEIPKYDGDLGTPNLFVPLAEAHCRRKVDAAACGTSARQRDKHWFTEDLFLGLMRAARDGEPLRHRLRRGVPRAQARLLG